MYWSNVSTQKNTYAISKKTREAVWNVNVSGELAMGMGHLYILDVSGGAGALINGHRVFATVDYQRALAVLPLSLILVLFLLVIFKYFFIKQQPS